MTNKKKDLNEENETLDEDMPVCFVIMPIADMPGYSTGHFTRVYEYLIKPAVKKAGYKPVRADDTSKTDYIVVGIINNIIESELLICDLSGKNANVMYELGIRHAFDKPVVLIKDDQTERVFDVQGLRSTEYATDLRIDNAGNDIIKIADSILETADAGNKDLNSLVKLAGLHAARPPEKTEISPDTKILLNAIESMRRNTTNSNFPEEEMETRNQATICLSTGRTLTIGQYIYLKDEKTYLKITGFTSSGNMIRVENKEGKVRMFLSKNIENKNIEVVDSTSLL